nr:hypothetical protein [Sphingorhabdus sp.]
MTYSNFANRVILALYRETEGDLSMRVELKKLIDKYGIVVEKPFWLNNLQNEWAGNLQAQFIDAGTSSQQVAIQINGVRVAEGLPAHILPEVRDVQVAVEFDEALSLAPSELPSSDIASVDWTGLSTKMSVAQLSEIKEKIATLSDAVVQSDADHQTKLNAIKRIQAVQLLLEAPDVPWREVVELLNSPYMAAFLTAVNIIQFIIGLA